MRTTRPQARQKGKLDRLVLMADDYFAPGERLLAWKQSVLCFMS